MRKFNLNFLLWLGFFGAALTVLACARSWGKFWLSSPSLTSFALEASINNLSKTYTGTISGDEIKISAPYAILSTAVPTFTFAGTSVKAGSLVLASGITPVDLTSTTSISIDNGGGSTMTYNLNVTALTPLLDTAQTTCYDSNAIQSCPVSGHPRQDGDNTSQPNPRAFTGPTQHPTYTADYTTRDTVSGLTYRSCAEASTLVTCMGGAVSTPGWAVATTTTCQALNTANSGAGYAGKKNWRMPTVLELWQLVDSQVGISPFITQASFPNTPGANTWASQAYAPNGANSWFVTYGTGQLGNGAVGTGMNVRCVAGDAPPAPSYVNLGDGTVLDNRTGLVWQQSISGSADWSNALTNCANLSLAGRKWRLPNKNELQSTIDFTKAGTPLINASVFSGSTGVPHWSSTTHGSAGATYAWYVDYFDGATNSNTKVTTYSYRCVSEGS